MNKTFEGKRKLVDVQTCTHIKTQYNAQKTINTTIFVSYPYENKNCDISPPKSKLSAIQIFRRPNSNPSNKRTPPNRFSSKFQEHVEPATHEISIQINRSTKRCRKRRNGSPDRKRRPSNPPANVCYATNASLPRTRRRHSVAWASASCPKP